MKKILTIITLVLCMALGVTAFAACGGEKDILVISRESGSGTRDAFDSLIKTTTGNSLAKKADGTRFDAIVKTADIQSSTGNVMTKVASSKTAIGYISLGSLNDTVKSVTIGGVTANAENVLNNTYKLQRPFIIATNKTTVPSAAVSDFLIFLGSKDAQDIIAANKFVRQDKEDSVDYNYTPPTSSISGEITIKGSSSVDPLMDKLIKEYQTKGGNKITGIEFSKDAEGSSQGISAAMNDTTGTVIGMSSSLVKPNEAESLNYFELALDAVVVVVNKTNNITDLTIDQLYGIYTGSIMKYSLLTK